MRKYKKILTFILGISLALQMNISVLASELPAETSEDQVEEMTEESEEDLELKAYIEEAAAALKEVTEQDVVMALIYLSDLYDIKKAPGIDKETCMQVPSGTTVQITGMEVDEEYNVWYQVEVLNGEDTITGYVDRNYLAYSHEAFLEWENNYFPKMAMFSLRGGYADVQQFPASYQAKLNSLKQAHPNWIFVKQDTGLNWDTVIANENYEDRNLVYKTLDDAYKNGLHSPGWYYASKEAVEYYMDPRNFLDETRVFQFEQLTFNASYHSLSAVENILDGTFMKGMIPEGDTTYASAFYTIGASLKVSPFHLACRVYQEQGQGTSALISGTYPGYEGYYNYYNIGASGTTTKQIVESGLKKAVSEGWNSRYAALQGGALVVSKNYILKGQDTLYLQKFDVEGTSLYTHQYMQNISAPYTEAQMVRNAYRSTGSLDNPFVFKIPVYNNMPSAACPVPGTAATPTPTAAPTAVPTAAPTAKPTAVPTAKPTAVPTAKPTAAPTAKPTAVPTAKPTAKPVATEAPAVKPTLAPTAKPTAVPTAKPTAAPTAKPTAVPTAKPTPRPTAKPVATAEPTAAPTAKPTAVPTTKPAATAKPTTEPTAKPTLAPIGKPTAKPTAAPTVKPTAKPTAAPTVKPTAKPTTEPTAKPTAVPTAAPTLVPTAKPTAAPTAKPTAAPTAMPTAVPTAAPTEAPVANLNENNTEAQTNEQQVQETAPTAEPTAAPTAVPDVTQGTTSNGVVIAAATPKPQTAVAEKPVVYMDMSESTTLYGETLEQMKEQNMEVILEMSDTVTWAIDSTTIDTEVLEDINLQVTVGESDIPEEMLAALTEQENFVELSLAHDGEFGFTAEMTIEIQEAKPGQYANLFYYNEETQGFEFICAAVVDKANKAAFKFSHASDYVIIISDETRETLLTQKAEKIEEAEEYVEISLAMPEEVKPAEEPKKAAGTIIIILAACIVVVLGTLVLLLKKK